MSYTFFPPCLQVWLYLAAIGLQCVNAEWYIYYNESLFPPTNILIISIRNEKGKVYTTDMVKCKFSLCQKWPKCKMAQNTRWKLDSAWACPDASGCRCKVYTCSMHGVVYLAGSFS